MKLEGEYKEVKIVFDKSLENILLEELEKCKIVKYCIIPKMKVSWEPKVKHLDTHVWPGEDSAMLLVLEKKECYELIEKLLILKEKLIYNTTFSIMVKEIEYINV